MKRQHLKRSTNLMEGPVEGIPPAGESPALSGEQHQDEGKGGPGNQDHGSTSL
jgi:hypothetical protein